jgi:tetratricopeptide (TPR) repeat protein
MNPRTYELPDSPFAPALAFVRAHRFADAILAIEKVPRASSGGDSIATEAAGALAHVARLAEAEGDLDAARRALTSAVALRPGFPDLHVDRARVLLASAGGRSREARVEARKALDTALRIHPGYTTARLQRALLDASEGLIGEALESLRSLASECRVEEPHVFEQALESLERADWEEAAVLLQQALPPAGADAGVALDRAREAMERGDDAQAAQIVRGALVHYASYPDLHLLLGSAEFRRGNLDDALASLAHALELNPDFHAARIQFARVLEALGQSAQAAEQVALVLEQEPEHVGARELIGRWSSRGRRSEAEWTGRKPS